MCHEKYYSVLCTIQYLNIINMNVCLSRVQSLDNNLQRLCGHVHLDLVLLLVPEHSLQTLNNKSIAFKSLKCETLK